MFSYLKAIVWSNAMVIFVIGGIGVFVMFSQVSSQRDANSNGFCVICGIALVLVMTWGLFNRVPDVEKRLEQLKQVTPLKKWLKVHCPSLAHLSLDILADAETMEVLWNQKKEKTRDFDKRFKNYTQEKEDLRIFYKWQPRAGSKKDEKPTHFVVWIKSGKKFYGGFDQSKETSYSSKWRLDVRTHENNTDHFYLNLFDYRNDILPIGDMLGMRFAEDKRKIWEALHIASNFLWVCHYCEVNKWLVLIKFLEETKTTIVGHSSILRKIRETLLESQVFEIDCASELKDALDSIDFSNKKPKPVKGMAEVLGEHLK